MTPDPDSDRLQPKIAGPQGDILEHPGFLLASIVQSCDDAIISKNRSGLVTSWNPAAVRLLGYTAEEMIGQPILRIVPMELQAEETEILHKVAAGERIDHFETVRVGKNGVRLDVSLTISPIRDYLGSIIGSSKILHDISMQKQDDEVRSRLAAIVDSSYDAIIGKNLYGIITSWNSAACAMFGYSAEEMIGQPILRLIPKELQAEDDEILRKLHAGIRVDHFRTKRIKKNGEIIDISLVISPVKNGRGQVIGSSKIARDITIEKRREEMLDYLSNHDQLTGLPSRQLLYDRLEMMLAQAQRNNARCAVIVVDLDRFKDVNDHHGHQAGDELLVEMATRLKSSLRAVDTVSRMGGDEFVILVSELRGPGDALAIADKLRLQIKKPFVLESQMVVTTSASIGICMSSEEARNGESLLMKSDAAMYRAKSAGGDQAQFYSEEIAQGEFRRREIVVALHEALRAEKFTLVYQPIIDLGSGATLGLECLLRLSCDRMGIIAPSEFIPIAEETGMIQPIGVWVFNKACQAISSLNRELNTALFISVNLSPRQLQEHDLLGVIEAAVSGNKLDPARVEVEITEGVLMPDLPEVVELLNGLRRVGVRIVIDDFGTGFSNIAYLWHFPIDRLKLDRSMIRGICGHSGSAVVTKATIALAHQLGISVIAEGVETLDQADVLRSADCDLAQGFYFSRPEPMNVIKSHLIRQLENA